MQQSSATRTNSTAFAVSIALFSAVETELEPEADFDAVIAHEKAISPLRSTAAPSSTTSLASSRFFDLGIIPSEDLTWQKLWSDDLALSSLGDGGLFPKHEGGLVVHSSRQL